jgi:hypothetical protein
MRAVRIGRQRAANQDIAIVKPRGDAVYCADEGALSAANHAEPHSIVRGHCFSVTQESVVGDPLAVQCFLDAAVARLVRA